MIHAAIQPPVGPPVRPLHGAALALAWFACAAQAWAQQAVPLPAAVERAVPRPAPPPDAVGLPDVPGPVMAGAPGAGVDRTTGASAAPPPAGVVFVPGGTRGVLFKVTPPEVAPLPAELATAPPALPGPAVAPSYLLGTIHFGSPQEQGVDYAALQDAVEQVDTFVNEADLDAPWQPSFDGYRWLPPGQPLASMVGDDAFERAKALLPKVRPQDMQRMKPWSVLALLEARGEDVAQATMDARLQRMAQAAGKRTVHLESLEQQLQALDCVPADEHAIVLRERLLASWILRIESAEAIAHYRGRNLDAWLAGIDRMQGLGDVARAAELRARRCLLEERNARWLGQLETLFQDGACFVAVGALHLVGPDGLIAALRRNGYRVEAVAL